ncbi:MAG TPA: hypothetical protein VMH81_06125 [Bryobacteraceae bacterium]|nr:hypothetical protein [Bryobacteraceae bacterium]
MRKSIPVLLLAALSLMPARAQQNADMYTMFGNPGRGAYEVSGTEVTAGGSQEFSSVLGFGYQLARVSPGTLWLDLSQWFGAPDDLQASLPGTGRTTWQAYTASGRLMVPLYRRLSGYAVTGVGGGLFHGIAVHGGSSPTVSTYRTYHGVFDFGGGLDFRLLRWFSVRAEVRDLVTGEQLSGVAGRQHVLPMFGMGFHF